PAALEPRDHSADVRPVQEVPGQVRRPGNRNRGVPETHSPAAGQRRLAATRARRVPDGAERGVNVHVEVVQELQWGTFSTCPVGMGTLETCPTQLTAKQRNLGVAAAEGTSRAAPRSFSRGFPTSRRPVPWPLVLRVTFLRSRCWNITFHGQATGCHEMG